MAATATARTLQKLTLRVQDVLTPAEGAVYADIARKYWEMRIAKGDSPETAKQALAAVGRLVIHFGIAPWRMREEHGSGFSAHLRYDRNCAVATIRSYQAHIRSYFDFILKRPKIKLEIREKFGVVPVQIYTPENSVRHRHPHEGRRERRPIPNRHVAMIFEALEKEAEKRFTSGKKGYWTLLRDKVILYLAYAFGFRREEIANLKLNSYCKNPEAPIFGDYGTWFVHGKGRCGGKNRSVQALFPRVRQIMDWYLTEVRPRLENPDKPTIALFLSERGDPISDDVPWQALQRALRAAGLTGYGYTLHCFRHTYITGSAPLMGLEGVRVQVGHVHQATTEGYYHPPLVKKGRTYANAVDRMIEEEEKT